MLLCLARPVTHIRIPAISIIFLYIYFFITSKVKADDVEAMAQLTESNLKFGLDVLKVLAKEGENIFFSPFSIQTVLAMLHIGSRNSSKSEIEKSLYFKSDSIHGSLGKYLEVLNKTEETYALSSANGLFINNKFKFLQDFLQKIKKSYKAVAEGCDFFGNADGEMERINKWVEGETNSKIIDLIPSGVLDPDTAMVLVNAIYFKGNWENKFQVEDTEIDNFTIDRSSYIEVSMMRMLRKFNYGYSDVLDCRMLELPYIKNDLSMFLILPEKIDGLAALEEKLSHDSLRTLMKTMYSVKVNVALPKFKLEANIDLKKILMSLGMSDIFDPMKADLSGIDDTKNLYISAALHKAFVEVNEEGTEAAAATAAVITKRSMPIIEQFNANHPFLFFIRDNRADVILFWGSLVKPDGNIVQHEEL